MTTFDARPQAASGTRPPGWLSAVLIDGGPSDRDAIFLFPDLGTSDPGCVAMARRFVDQTLGSWGAERAAFDASLVASELVTNAMRHGGGATQLRLLRQDAELACVVADHNRQAPIATVVDVFAEYGRGLRLVDALCTGWGWLTPNGPRKLVWAVLPG
ncbi:ATP-binding protein [Nonomuraea sp. LPB2021202275-12-8]|uniref:ATP-binding protein n=1 Tax=Nonomuraea sp. LPB2021202275-12-8 TaxID=3120159 RepID=UPI00300D5E29